jgi:hypothetical protein
VSDDMDGNAAPRIAAKLKEWTPDRSNIDLLVTLTARSLDTVSKLTQYEDEKANRILTPIAFLSAFVASLFAIVPAHFPAGSVGILMHEGIYYRAVLLALAYWLFGLYALLVGVGVAFVLHGVKPQFNASKAAGKTVEPKSLLFFKKIIEADPEDWANAFTSRSTEELAVMYVKNSISETYLVSEKIEKKLKSVAIGVRLFWCAALVVIALVPDIVTLLGTTRLP